MTLTLPLVSMDPFDLSMLPGGDGSIHVTDSYTLAAGDSLDVKGSPAFKLEVKSGSTVSLDIAGEMNVDGGADHLKAIGALTSRSLNGDATMQIEDTGTLTVSTDAAGGLALGALLFANDVSFVNRGVVQASASQGDAGGVAVSGDSGSVVNDKLIEVTAAGAGFGIGGSGLPTTALTVINNGTIQVTAGFVAGVTFVSSGATVINNGTISVVGTDPDPNHSATGIGVRNGGLVNNGLVEASGVGQVFGLGATDLTSVINNGHVVAVSSNGVLPSIGLLVATDALGGTATNNGLIQGDLAVASADVLDSVSGPVTNDVIINNGRLVGDVMLGGGSDGVSNTGHITGDVDLGDGGDIYIGNRGHLEGVLAGGLGNDNLMAGRADDLIYGDAQDNSLGGGDDVLRGMKGDDQLFGGQGVDTLIGGLGADTLTGGAGDDLFQFVKLADSGKAIFDLITDLGVGADKIDLSAVDADTATGGDQAFHLVSSFGGHAGELTVSYDSGTGLTTIAGDVDGDGAADLVITASGDHSGFSAFVY